MLLPYKSEDIKTGYLNFVNYLTSYFDTIWPPWDSNIIAFAKLLG